ncbi:putative odorant receptor 45a [Lucilia cuprina]|uniref:Odorant receptor n=1 Tax=Lucilia cuprina TaxID=7375 RepID=A0A0L0BRT7_LUCCU|nr:putative odorant receptor 45a [Lucilia cuprina]
MGIDINNLKRRKLLKDFGKFVLLISCTIYLEYGLIRFVAQSVSNIDKATGALSMFNQGCLILIKISVFLTKGDKFMKLIWDMNLLAMRANPEEYKKWLSENQRSQLIGKMYFYACWIAVGCAGVVPIIFMIYDYKQNGVFNGKLPFGGKFPFDQFGQIIFALNYILSLIYIYALLNMTVGIDTLYGWYIYNISAHFRILRCKVESVALKLKNNDNENFIRDIGSIVNYHNKTINFTQDLNNIFGEILWAEVMLSCLQMCFAIYTLNNDDDVSNMPFNFMVLVAVVMQLMIYCFGGEKIKNESLMLCLDFYLHFPWHKMPAQQKKLMLLPLMRAQTLSVLRGLFFEVDRNLLVYVSL